MKDGHHAKLSQGSKIAQTSNQRKRASLPLIPIAHIVDNQCAASGDVAIQEMVQSPRVSLHHNTSADINLPGRPRNSDRIDGRYILVRQCSHNLIDMIRQAICARSTVGRYHYKITHVSPAEILRASDFDQWPRSPVSETNLSAPQS